jgi:hypothetical protein
MITSKKILRTHLSNLECAKRLPVERSAKTERNKPKQQISMKFLSIYKTVETGTLPTPEEMTRMGKLIEEGMKAGVLLAVEGCMPSAAGARVRLSKGKITVTDGPFTEAKEVIGGLAILQADSKEAAVAVARQFLHAAGDGECELRQLFEAEPATQGQTVPN